MDIQKLSILLVEDDSGDIELFREYLSEIISLKIDLQIASRLTKAKDMVSDDLDLIFLDLGLPDSKGISTLESMMDSCPDVPIIVLTGLNDEEIGLDAVRIGAQDYLIKSDLNSSLLGRSINYSIERYRNQQDLRESRKMMELILNNIPQRVFWKDRESRYLGCNQPFAHDCLLEKPEEVIGKFDSELAWVESAAKYLRDDSEVMDGGIARIGYEETQIRNDGKFSWVQTSKIPIRDDRENIIGILGTYDDITRRKMAEAEIKELNEVLKLMNKILRHDLANYLHFIAGSLTIHRMKNDDESMDNAEFYLKRCYDIIDNMRNLESVMMNRSESQMVEISSRLREESKKFPIDIEIRGECEMEINESFSPIVNNLINNAIKHGGTDRMVIEVKLDDGCEIRFRDFGKGVPDEMKKMIFDEGFSYGKNKSTGMGLYIVRKLVERCGGTIHVEDNEPNGAVFIIRKRKLGCPPGQLPDTGNERMNEAPPE